MNRLDKLIGGIKVKENKEVQKRLSWSEYKSTFLERRAGQRLRGWICKSNYCPAKYEITEYRNGFFMTCELDDKTWAINENIVGTLQKARQLCNRQEKKFFVLYLKGLK